MEITIVAIGSRGDVQPLVALGVGLQQKGHLVHVVAGDEFESLIQGAKLGFSPLGMNIQAAMESHTDLFRFMASIKDRVLKVCETTQDAVVSTFLGVSTCSLAREREIPFFYALPMPGLQTHEFPHPLFLPLPLGKRYNALTYRLSDKHVTASCEDARCLFLEPPPTYLFCFSPTVVPRPSDWGDFAHVTGYWFLDRPSDWRPPAKLEAFLETGPSPVYVGFGSALGDDPRRLTALVLDALASAGQRGVLASGWGALGDAELSPDVFVIDSVPHDWLFPRVAAAIHHGGAGTTAAALRCGTPSVIVPFGLDQPFWGRRVRGLGAAAEPIALKRLTVERLATAIRSVVEDTQIRERATMLGERIRSEDGVGNAVGIIERAMTAR